jgi:hypothetical protein
MNEYGLALAAVENALRAAGIKAKRVEESEFFIGLSYERGGAALAAVCFHDGLNFAGGVPVPPWADKPAPEPTGREKAMIRAHAALYYGN